MKNLFLLTALVASYNLMAIDSANIETLADSVYTTYMQGVIESLHTQDHEEFEESVTECKSQPAYQELHHALAASFAAETEEERRSIAEPIIIFAKSLQKKLANHEQIIADFNITNKNMIEQITVAAKNQVAYFEALKAYGLQHAFLYTVDDLPKYQKEIDTLTTHIADLFCSPFSLTTDQFRAQTGMQDFEKKLTKLKKSSLIKSLQRELVQANKQSGNWATAEKSAANVRLFMQLLELKLTNKAAIMKKYTITDPEMVQFCDWVIDNVNMRLVLTNLGFTPKF